MSEVYIFEGKTTNEAIEKGLSELKVSKSKVDIKVIESEEKRSFFSILTPRVVKVEMRLKEDNSKNKKEEQATKKKENKYSEKKEENKNVDFTDAIKKIDKFLKEFLEKMPNSKLTYEITTDSQYIFVNINGDNTGVLIGYRGEVLNAIQNIVTNIANKESEDKIRVLVNIGGYREKRKKDLENLAAKIANTVIKTKKSITLEPMSSYERKIIHSKLQENEKVKTYSIGEEPFRKVVVALK